MLCPIYAQANESPAAQAEASDADAPPVTPIVASIDQPCQISAELESQFGATLIDALAQPDANQRLGESLQTLLTCPIGPIEQALGTTEQITEQTTDEIAEEPAQAPATTPITFTEAQITERARSLINANADLNITNDQGRHSLLIWLQYLAEQPEPSDDALKLGALLLNQGADPLLADNTGTTPLHLAAQLSEPSLTEQLLSLKADPLSRDSNNRSVLGEAASGSNNSAAFFALLDATLADRSASSLNLNALASRALLARDYFKLDRLIGLANENDQTLTLANDALTETLALALWADQPEQILERLSATGANIAALHEHGGGDLAWYLATQGNTERLDWLLDNGYPLNQLPESGFPPLYYANLSATEQLLARGADPNLNSREYGPVAAAFLPPSAPFDGSVGKNAGGNASSKGELINEAKFKRLVDGGYDIDLQDNQGRTALEIAVEQDTFWLAAALLELGASPLLVSEGDSVLPKALIHSRLTLVQQLLRLIPDHATRHPDLLLNYLAQTPAPDLILVEALLVAGTPLENKNAEGETAMLLSAKQQQWGALELLLRYNADASATNQQGCGLHCYAWSMPAHLQQFIRPVEDSQGWQMPTLEQRPVGFFALALIPTITLWLLWIAFCLARYQGLLGPSFLFFLCATTGVLAGGSLFYQCAPCVVSDPIGQLAATGGISLALIMLTIVWWAKRKRAMHN